jgi:hypothetical protein
VSEPLSVFLTWPAIEDLRRIEWHPERELGGILLGVVTPRHIEVRQILTNPHGPQMPTHTDIEWDAFRDIEEEGYPYPWRRKLVVGDIHSHPCVGVPRASGRDFDEWAYLSEKLHQPFCGLIFSPSTELWQEGYPTGRGNWDELEMRAWVTADGQCWSTLISEQDPFIHAFEDRQHAMREAQETDALISKFTARQRALREESTALPPAAAPGDA